VEIVSPDGRRSKAPMVSGGVALSLDQIGVFDLVDAGGRSLARVAANLASPSESDVAPRSTLRIGPHVARPLDVPPPARRGQPWWLLLAMGACAFAICEWLTFHRR